MEDKSKTTESRIARGSHNLPAIHKKLSEHKFLKHLALHVLIAVLYSIVFYLQKRDREIERKG
ncbi:MAG: hypothetical protein A3B99_00330 [Candidatus Yanofskybacteria bacterium RIFCSPHIGHO2_02_FULL_44_12b]|uniref:Uncharacterized protein n=1 Tax=Candidatus Yanofskybacteria bacterium RIFCSPLOWO2_01_FULL_44_22 TaxID=1802697 RepID=A0A1F8GII2_9BACT|nr:MAG: hypothetical protein A3B99_00330 [Candidatus Yanofskybacteria bacterium RIFCSPHIGHO2_02_FULL_44_12b]OGN25123.1 MAG: hypothetical protein A2925_02700 [Candidatus Yanofskybacteria bacterium RIFCSPLOWO2_01_FULL_44_22]